MTRREAAQLVERWRKRLAPHWAVDVHFLELPGERANVQRQGSFDEALLCIDKGTLRQDADRDVEVTIVHEVLHLAFFDWADAAERMADHLDESDLLRVHLEAAEERVVQRLARVLVGYS